MEETSPSPLLDEFAFENIDITKIMALHAEVKDQIPLLERTSNTIAVRWAASGKYMENLGNWEGAEICFFMANLYDKSNIEYIEALIECYIHNRKFKFAIDLTKHLYLTLEGTDDSKFWMKLVSILPTNQIQGYLTSPNHDSLDGLISKFGLDSEEPMTWMCLGYTLKANDIDPVLANQALDNALALKYFS